MCAVLTKIFLLREVQVIFMFVIPVPSVGHHIVFETVAGRTSAIVPSLQHKNGGEFCRPLTAPPSSLPSAGIKVMDLESSIAEEDSSGSNKNEIIMINNDSATLALTRNTAEKKRKRK